ncbi:histidine ammonia-lyase, partial [Dethiosulfovibrio sp. F2B]|nr:histidine ammonia-lyase [Dethiosulfovibrio faecalis]
IDFSKPLNPGKGTKAAYDRFREEVPYIEKDVFLYPLIDQAISIVKSGTLVEAVETAVGELD